MDDAAVDTDEGRQKEIPTEWPRKLHPAPAVYHYPVVRIDGAKIREQGLARYRRDPEAWKAAVRKWREANAEYWRAYCAWWWKVNRNEARLTKMRDYTKAWRLRKRQANGSAPSLPQT